jgi:transposase
VPEETARVAHAIFPKGNVYLRLADTFGSLFQDTDFAELFPVDGQPALSPVRLMLVLILQFAEGLSDRQAAEAVRTRIDWKYLLCLEITDSGFDYSVLSEFRARLIEHAWEQKLFDQLLSHVRAQGLLKGQKQQRTDSTHVLGAIRDLTRLELVGETLRYALDSLAVVAPDWTRAHCPVDWLERYGARLQEYRLPKGHAKRDAYAEVIGADGLTLWQALFDPATPSWLREIPAVQTLQRVWLQNYTWRENGVLRWRLADELPPALLAIRSPFDPEARFAHKRATDWVGYRVHLTETCEPEAPRIITHIETSAAPSHDGNFTTPIHAALQARGLLPTDHLVDTAYLDAALLVSSREQYGVNLVGPTRQDTTWQARQGGNAFIAKDFQIDWERQSATCPAGQRSQFWLPAIDSHGQPVIQIKFAKRDCRGCSLQTQCTRATPPRRALTVPRFAQYQALQAARERETTQAYAELYARRSGVEGTLSLGVRMFDLRRARYLGKTKLHLQHLLIAMAINLTRIARWLDEPLTQARPSAFKRLFSTAPPLSA